MYGAGDERFLKIANEASEQATQLAPNYAESFLARGYAYLASKQYATAEAQFFKAIELDPGMAIAYHYLARSAYLQGEMEKTIEHFNKSIELDPDDYESPLLLHTVYQKFDDQENALRVANISVERVKRYLENYPEHHRAYYLGAGALAFTGDVDMARQWAERADQLAPGDRGTRYNLACFYARLGENEKALEFLENSITSRTWIANDPDLECLHDHPRFQAVLDSLDP